MYLIYLTIVFGVAAVTFFFAWLGARHQLGRWESLENRQAQRNFELQQQITDMVHAQYELDKFRRQPGMETVSDAIAKRIIAMQDENLKITAELNTIRLEAAKYMDLYRHERFKPRQKQR
jgi:hypothetical protein